MTTTVATRVLGPTYAMSVGVAQHAAVAIAPVQGDTCNFAEFTNPGVTDVCVVTAPWSATPSTPALIFPLDGSPTIPNSFMLPHGMTFSVVKAVPGNGFSVSAIGAAITASIIYITPVASM